MMTKNRIAIIALTMVLGLAFVGCAKEDDDSSCGTIQVINNSGTEIESLYIESYRAYATKPQSSSLLNDGPLFWQKYMNVDLDPGDYMIAYTDYYGGYFLIDSSAIARITLNKGEFLEIEIGPDYWECFSGRSLVASGSRGLRRFSSR